MCCSLTHAAIFPSVFFFNATAPTEIYTLSLHDALPISGRGIVGLLGLPGDHSVLHVDLPGAGAGAVDAVGGAHDLVMAPPLAVEGVAAAATHPVGLAIVLGDALGAAEHPARPDQGVHHG